MNTDNEYYTPSVEEFHIGFRYEEKKDGEWCNKVFCKAIEMVNIAAMIAFKTGFIRCKRLSHECILECGWEKVLSDAKNHTGAYTKNKDEDCKHVLQCYFGNNNRIKNVKITISVLKGYEIVFYGNLANISELRKIMKQVGI